MDHAFAQGFASDWIEAWNAHDLQRILSHYAEDVVLSSPMIVQLTGEASGLLHGKAAVGAYWAKALARVPDLRFELLSVLLGVDSVTLTYKGVRARLAAEVFHFGAGGQVQRAYAHYAAS